MSIRTLRAALLSTAMLAAVAPAAALAQASPSPYTTGFRYDAAQRVVGTITPDPDDGGGLFYRAVRQTYDDAGHLIRVEVGKLSAWQSEAVAPKNWSGFTVLKRQDIGYDSVDRKIREIVYAGSTAYGLTQYSYNNAGLYDCVAVRMNVAAFQSDPLQYSLANSDACAATAPPSNGDGSDRITRTDYFPDRKVKKVTSGYAVQAMVLRENTYTNNGLLSTEKDGEQNLTFHEYDPYDRLKRTYYPQLTARSGGYNAADYEEYGYDNNSNQISWRRRDNITINTAFNGLNVPSSKSVPAADTGALSYAYYYDNAGNLISASEGGRTVNRIYDGFGRLQSEGGPLGTVSYSYDAGSRRSQLSWPDSFNVTYKYDNTDSLIYICRSSSPCSESNSAADKIAGFVYDDLGRRTSISRAANGASTTYGYDATNLRLSSLGQFPTSAGDEVSFSFAYNAAGQVKTRTITNSAYVWRPLSAPNRPYSIDGLNRIVDSGDKPVSPQTTRAGYTTYGYDGRGNLKCIGARSDVGACADPTTTYLYDGANRLRGAAQGGSLIYDPLGRLYQSTNNAGTVTRYLYDGANMIGEYNGSNIVQRRYVFGSGPDEVLAWFDATSITPDAPRWLLADYQGSIIANLSNSGAVTAKNTYDEYGLPGPSNSGLFQYTGQIYLAGLDLYHYKARAYSPTLGRFLQADPTGYDDGLNWYAYVGDDPLNKSDPTGNAGCGNLSKDQCGAAMEAQGKALQGISNSRAGLAAYRADPNSAAGAAFGKQFERAFGKGALTAGNLGKYEKAMNFAEKWLRDPGAAKGGSFDYRVGETGGRGGTIVAGNSVFSSDWYAGRGGADLARRANDSIHERLHQMPGLGRDRTMGAFPNFYQVYGASADAALAASNPASALGNADNYSRLMMGEFK